jgi:hypothetical protein
MCPAVVLSTFSQEGDIFSICFRTGEFLFDFLKVVHWLLNLLRLDVCHNTSRMSGRHLLFKQEKKPPFTKPYEMIMYYTYFFTWYYAIITFSICFV